MTALGGINQAGQWSRPRAYSCALRARKAARLRPVRLRVASTSVTFCPPSAKSSRSRKKTKASAMRTGYLFGARPRVFFGTGGFPARSSASALIRAASRLRAARSFAASAGSKGLPSS